MIRVNGGKHDAKKPEHKINIFVNGQKYEVTQDTMTPRQILVELAHENIDQAALSLKEEGKLAKYENLDQPINLKNGMKFVVTYTGTTPVS